MLHRDRILEALTNTYELPKEVLEDTTLLESLILKVQSNLRDKLVKLFDLHDSKRTGKAPLWIIQSVPSKSIASKARNERCSWCGKKVKKCQGHPLGL